MSSDNALPLKSGTDRPADPPAEWLTPQAAATLIGVEVQSIYDNLTDLRHTRVGGKKLIRIRRTWLTEWMERHAQNPG